MPSTTSTTRDKVAMCTQDESLAQIRTSGPAKCDDVGSKDTALEGFKTTKFAEEVPEKFKCSVCKRVLRKPHQTPCGHHVCEECLKTLRRTEDPRCPVDNESLDMNSVFMDRCCEREILSLQCYCTFRHNGCKWKGFLQDLEGHINDCEFSEKLCTNPGCTKRLTKQTIQDHVENRCDYRRTPCDHCGEPIPLAEREDHVHLCPKVRIPCTSECGSEVPRDLMTEHLTMECLLAQHLCSYAANGCEFKGTKVELQQHNKEATDKHLMLVTRRTHENVCTTNKLENEFRNLVSKSQRLETQLERQNETLAATRQDLRTQQMKLCIVERNVSEQKKELTNVREKLNASNGEDALHSTQVTVQLEECINFLRATEDRIKNLEGELGQLKVGHLQQHSSGSLSLSASSMSVERRLDKNEHHVAVHDIQLVEHDLKLQILEATSYDGQFIWKIDDWTRRYHEAVSGKTASLYSPPFYVGRFGYKVCARLYPNGDGMGKGSHVSLFFVVMKGEYDALLPWPFKQKVTFQLFDQNHQLDIADAFRPDPNSSSFKKPTTNMNIASGCPLFISHTDLHRRTYIRDDTMFIKVTVDKTGVPAL